MNRALLNYIVSCSDTYYRTNLRGWNPNALKTDWWVAFDFFIAHACYQGRRDTSSDLV
jgi:hypothetical protein